MANVGKISFWSLPSAALLLLLTLCVFASDATERAKHTTIPISIDEDNRMHVYLDIEGETAIGVIDTAATFPLIDRRILAPEQRLETEDKIEILGVNGKRLFDVVALGHITAGNQKFSNLLVARNDNTQFPGPKNIFPAMQLEGRVLDFNFEKNRLDIYDGPPARMRLYNRSRLSYSEVNKLPFIEVTIDGVKGRALIDTGSDTSYINSAFADAANLSEVIDSSHELVGADGNKIRIRSINVRRFRLGRFRYRKFSMLAADTALFNHLGMTNEPVMVLGLDVLRQYRLQIDRGAKKIYLSQANGRFIETRAIPTLVKNNSGLR